MVNEKRSLKEKTAKGLLWGGVSNAIQQLLNLFFGIFLARLLTPADYGMVGMLSIFVLLASALQESGFISALANRQEVKHEEYNAVFWFSTLMGLALYLLLFACAPLIADFYGKPELIPLSRVLFLGFLISSSGTAHNAALFKNLMVRQKATAQIVGLCVSGSVGITLALHGMAYWGIAIQSVSYIATSTSLFWYFSPWRPSWHIDFRPLRGLIGFSSKMLATNMVTHLNNNLFTVLLGRLFSPAEVGHYTQASKWSYMGYSLVTGMVGSVAQPVLAQVADDADRQRKVFRKMLRFTAFVSFPSMLGLALIARELIVLAVTDKWLPCVPILQMLSLWSAFLPIQQLYSHLIVSRQKSNIQLWNTLMLSILQLLTLWLTHPYGIPVMVMAYVGLNIAYLLVWHSYVHQAIGLRLTEVLRDVLPFALLAGGVMIVTWYATRPISSPLPLLLAKILLAATLYAAILWFSRAVVFRESIEFLLSRLQRKA